MREVMVDKEVNHTISSTEELSCINAEALRSVETPCFVFDPAPIIRSYRALRAALGTPLLVSIKANPNPELLMHFVHEFRDGAEVASLGELNVVVGRLSHAKYVASPALDETLVLAADACRATIVLDSDAQADLMLRLLPKLRHPPAVFIRINANALLRDYTGDIRPDHFGVEPASACVIATRLDAVGIRVSGLHVFAGSGSFVRTASHIVSAITPVIDEVSEKLQQQLPCVNLGGGFTSEWVKAVDFMCTYRDTLAPLLSRMTVLHEAGRAIFEPGARFLTRVVSVKTIHGNRVAVCDGGMAHAFRLAQTEQIVKTLSMPVVLRCAPLANQGLIDNDDIPTRYVGNSCNPADVIGFVPKGSAPQVGDIVMFEQCGAYHTYTPTGFLNLRPARKYLLS